MTRHQFTIYNGFLLEYWILATNLSNLDLSLRHSTTNITINHSPSPFWFYVINGWSLIQLSPLKLISIHQKPSGIEITHKKRGCIISKYYTLLSADWNNFWRKILISIPTLKSLINEHAPLGFWDFFSTILPNFYPAR